MSRPEHPERIPSYVNTALLWAAVLGASVGGFLTYCLFEVPFGARFNASLFLLVGGTILFLFLSGARLRRAANPWKKVAGFLLCAISVLLLAAAGVVAVDHRIILFHGPPPEMTDAMWRDDLHYLADTMVDLHPDLFARVPRETFEAAVDELDRSIPSLTDNQIAAEMFKVLSLPNDAHSFPVIIYPTYDLHLFPLRLYDFDDGLYVIASGRGYEHTIGSRLVKIGATDIDSVFERLRNFVAAENEYGWRDRFCSLAVLAELLESQGIIESADGAEFTFADDQGEQYTVWVESVGSLPWYYWYRFRKVANDAPPAFTNDRVDKYRLEMKEEGGAIHLLFNQVVARSGDETMEEFSRRLGEFVDTHDFDRLVIDLRVNGGGGGGHAFPLVNLLSNHRKINRKGKLFVLIGRNTYSAAVIFAAMLRNTTEAVFIGEPTGQGPNFYSGPTLFTLPNSRWAFTISTRSNLASHPEDDRAMIVPDIPVSYTYRDFENERDPVMEAALAYQPTPSDCVSLDEETSSRYLGRYAFSPSQILTIHRDGGRLSYTISDFVETSYLRFQSELCPVSPTDFLANAGAVEIRFRLDGSGRVEGLEYDFGGVTRSVVRAPDGYRLPMEWIREGRIDDGVGALLDDIEENRKRYPGMETSLNLLGYKFMAEEDYRNAIQIFRLNAELYPESYNVFDSLAEALMMNGDKMAAAENYERSLELNPHNTNALKALKKLND